MTKSYLCWVTAILLCCGFSRAHAQGEFFGYTGNMQTYTVDSGITSICVDVVGAQGGLSTNGLGFDTGGFGGRVMCNLMVTAGQVLYIAVGGAGTWGWAFSAPTPGGYNGGGAGFVEGAGGGGASDIRVGDSQLTSRVVVAGGGGGGGIWSTDTYLQDRFERGGPGGNTTGGDGFLGNSNTYGGKGGTQTAGGAAGSFTYPSNPGSLGAGGDAGLVAGSGGGGGGYYGGGGCTYGGGGGGSSFAAPGLTSFQAYLQGYNNAGNGYVNIIMGGCPSSISGPGRVCTGANITLTDAFSGGKWTSGNNSIATVDSASGLVTGIAPGVDTITYRYGNIYVTYGVVTVVPSPAGFTVPDSLCVGNTVTLTDTTAGGRWSCAPGVIAAIDSVSGILTGNAAGIAVVTYMLPATGCRVARQVSIITCIDEVTGPANAKAAVIISPNPAVDQISVHADGGFTTCTITNPVGQVVLQQPVVSSRTIIGIQSLPAGTYYVILNGSMGRAVGTFVKNE